VSSFRDADALRLVLTLALALALALALRNGALTGSNPQPIFRPLQTEKT